MIETIIFDFGNVFINLNDDYTLDYIKHFELSNNFEKVIETNNRFEMGLISKDIFLARYMEYFPGQPKQAIIDKWNSILVDFPIYRMEFLHYLRQTSNYKLILLSNTNELHIDRIKDQVLLYEDFKSCFDGFYLSHEIRLRKPNHDSFRYVLDNHNLKPENTLFIDDTLANTKAASELGIHVWNINPKKDDVINLFSHKKGLF